jgi:hypothetical protein
MFDPARRFSRFLTASGGASYNDLAGSPVIRGDKRRNLHEKSAQAGH